MSNRLPVWQASLLERHQLPESYIDHALHWFMPLAEVLSAHQSGAGKPILVGINGTQGSGKTTLCDFLGTALAEVCGCRVVNLSLDDFYLTRPERSRLAETVHPLFATRGVPGTHDMALLAQVLEALLTNDRADIAVPIPLPIPVPRFNKAQDDRSPAAQWSQVGGPVDVVLLEGWCLGVRPQPDADLVEPINTLEKREDTDGTWRRYVNERLRRDFLPLYDSVDQWVMLKAPSFEHVLQWRSEQEAKLARRHAANTPGHIMDAAQLARFVQFYERLTRWSLRDLPPAVHHLFELDAARNITAYLQRPDGVTD